MPNKKIFNLTLQGKRKILGKITSIILIFFLMGLIWDLSSIRVPIFGFHDIYEPGQEAAYTSNAPYLDYSATDLEIVLNQLVQENYWFLSSQEIDDYFISKRLAIPSSRQGVRPIAISFDDASESVHTIVLPIVKKIEQQQGIKIPLILFLNSGRMDEKEAKSSANKARYLTCDEIREGFAEGFYDVQSAGKDHLLLTKKSSSDIESDLKQSQDWLRQCLEVGDIDTPIAKHFAYPYNRVNAQVEEVASEFHATAYRYDKRLQRIGWTTRRYRISRLGVRDNTPRWKVMGEAHRASKL